MIINAKYNALNKSHIHIKAGCCDRSKIPHTYFIKLDQISHRIYAFTDLSNMVRNSIIYSGIYLTFCNKIYLHV